MKRELMLGGAIVNCTDRDKTDELLDYLVNMLKEIELYKLKPKPGSLTATAFDWQIMIGTTASIYTIGQALWYAYRKFIKPIREKNQNSSTDLYINIRTEDMKFEEFMIGKNFKDKESFLKAFGESVKKLEEEPFNPEKMHIIKNEIQKSETWVHIKKIV